MNRLKPIISFFKVPDLTVSGLKSHISHLAFLALLFTCSEIRAQTLPVGDPFETYHRILQLDMDQGSTSSFLLRPASYLTSPVSHLKNHPWSENQFYQHRPQKEFTFYAPEFTRTYNSDMAFGQNDGAMWQGRGYNYAFSLGASYQYGPVEIAFRPRIGYSENRKIDLAPNPPFFSSPFDLSEYAQGLARIDAPQRFGDDPVSWFHPGQSFLRLSHSGFAGGISTQNRWTGPAMHNPLTMSNNAAGFFHGFLETDGPFTTPAGNFEARWFWGGLQESDYFDDDPSNNLRYITGITAGYSPSFIKGLHLGFSRTFIENYSKSGLAGRHIFRVLQPFTEDRFALDNQTDSAIHMLSFFGRWVIPEYGFEFWAEWGRNDNSFDQRNAFREPVHTRSYVLGFLKRFNISEEKWLVWDTELTQLENLENTQTSYPVWYEHHYVKQGFTHQGQVLGAGIGPGSSNLRMGVTYYEPRGSIGLSINRVVNNNDRLFRHKDHIRRNQERILRDHWGHDIPQYPNIYDLYDTEYRFGGHTVLFLPYNIELQADLHYSFFMNRHNIYENDINNLHTVVTFRYVMKGMKR